MSWWFVGAAAASTAWGAYSDSQGNRQDARNGYLGGAILGTAGAGSYLAGGSAAAGAAGGGDAAGGSAAAGGSDGLAVNLGGGSMGTLGASGLDSSGSIGASSGSGGILDSLGGMLPGLSSGLGSFFGGQQQAAGYNQAGQTLQGLANQAPVAANYSDPFNQYRGQYAQQLNAILSGQQSIQTDPGYQFQQQQGQQAVQRSAAAQGLGQSGNVMTALQQRGQDIANQQYNTIINRLTGLAGATPQNAMSAGGAYSNLIGQGMSGVASTQVGSGMSSAAGTSGLLSGIGSAIGSLF